VPITKGGRLVGILTTAICASKAASTFLSSKVMTKENLITFRRNHAREAEQILHDIASRNFWSSTTKQPEGFDHGKDIQKKLKYPNAAKDSHGRLRVGAATGATR